MRKLVRVLLVLLALVVLLAAAGYAAAVVMTTVPGTSHTGPLPPLTDEERDLAPRLMRHVEAIGARPHNVAHADELTKAARYIEAELESLGYTARRISFTADGVMVHNIDALVAGATPEAETLVVGAHYDSCEDAPGANDNATGVAGVLELARLLKDLDGKAGKQIRLALFANEEPPYFMTRDMGSLRYAEVLRAQGEKVAGMYSLETIGYYSPAPGSQNYPPPFGLIFGDRGDFIAFVAMSGSRGLLDRTVASFRSHTQFPSVGGAAPSFIPGISWSDHWSFEKYGFEALMVTDTAPFRYPHYHEPTDTPDKIDPDMMARVVKGMERVIREAAK